MERTITTYTTVNAINNESRLKERMITMMNTIKTKAAHFISNRRKKAAESYILREVDILLQAEKTRAHFSNYAEFKLLR